MSSPQLMLLVAEEAVKAVGQAQRARAQTKMARYEADLAQQQAIYQRGLADADAARARRRSDRLLGRQVAAFAAAGLDPGAGSALLAQQSLASEAEMEALEIRNAGRIRAAALDRSAALTVGRARVSAQQGLGSFGSRLLDNSF